jgi:hypothetical protein
MTELRTELMQAQIRRLNQEMRWEMFKAFSTFVPAALALVASGYALAVWVSPHIHWVP